MTKLGVSLKRRTDPSGRQKNFAGLEEESCCCERICGGGHEERIWGWSLEARRGSSPVSKKKNTETHSRNSKELSSANNRMSLEEELPRGTPWFQPGRCWVENQRGWAQTSDPWKLWDDKWSLFSDANCVVIFFFFHTAIENTHIHILKPCAHGEFSYLRENLDQSLFSNWESFLIILLKPYPNVNPSEMYPHLLPEAFTW